MSCKINGEQKMIHFYKILNSDIPELHLKIIGRTENPPESGFIDNLSGPSMWAILDPTPLDPNSHELFWKLFAERDKVSIDWDIKIFNETLENDMFVEAKVLKTLSINDMQFVVMDFNKDFCLIMMMGRVATNNTENTMGGDEGYFWIEDFYDKRTRKDAFMKVFGLTKDEAHQLATEVRKIKR